MDKSKQKKGSATDYLPKLCGTAAGADLGAREHVVAVGPERVGQGECAIRSFATHRAGIEQLVSWLLDLGISTLAMEATGVYWLGIYEALEQAGIEVCLVNARHLKNVSGRKTDVSDAAWIQQLHSYGLLRSSFVAEQVVRDLRTYVRQREELKQEKSRALQHMHKALDMMNVKVHHYIKNMDGPTGLKILRAIAAGQTDSEVLSQFHSRQLKVTMAELEVSLRGNYRAAHIFSLGQALQRYDFAAQQIQDCELHIERQLILLSEGQTDLAPLEQPLRPLQRKAQKNEYRFALKDYLGELTGVDVTAIDGLTAASVLDIISETGLELKQHWPSAQHFTSWLQLSPRVKISGGKTIGHFHSKGVSRASEVFRLAAFGLVNSKSALGAFYRSVRARRGPKIAIKATARKIAVIYYHMLTQQQEYRHTTQQEYEQQQRSRRIKRLKKQASALGFEVREAA